MPVESGRFAPSPSGRMHLGNALSAMLAWLSAKHQGGEILLRIEDLDPARSKAEYAQGIMDDFRWLGLLWDRRATDQSKRGEAYAAALRQLDPTACFALPALGERLLFQADAGRKDSSVFSCPPPSSSIQR